MKYETVIESNRGSAHVKLTTLDDSGNVLCIAEGDSRIPTPTEYVEACKEGATHRHISPSLW